MLEYSDTGQNNVDIFLDGTYPVFVFFEDKKKEYFYEALLERVLGELKKQVGVHCLNGKTTLIKKYNDIQDGRLSHYIFVVDGDFDLLLEEKMINDEKFIYLKKYNIESYLLQKESIVKYVRGKSELCRDEVEKKLEYDEWYDSIIKDLGEVFIWSALLKKHTDETAIRNNIIDSKTGKISYEIKENQRKKVKKINDYEKKLKYLNERFCSLYDGDYSYIICGKVLLNSFVHYLKFKMNCSIFHKDLIQFLLNDISLNEFLNIKNVVEKYANKL